jgi:ABC-2 type transport system permease protein
VKILAVILKSLIEQYRQFWILILTLFMAPFFIGVYFLMWEATTVNISVEVVNLDKAYSGVNYGFDIENIIKAYENDTLPVDFSISPDREEAVKMIKNKKASAVLLIPQEFSENMVRLTLGESIKVPFEISGDLSDFNYLLAASWTYELMVGFISEVSGTDTFYEFRETPVGISGDIDEFDVYVPGLLVLSIVMLMFTASIAFVREPEQRTMIRLKLSRIKNWELISGISIVQVLIGFIAIMLSLIAAALLGFEFSGSWALFILTTFLTSVSIIGFSLIIASFTRTVNQVLVVGNFPLFLFMFFTGAMMPVHGPTLFTFASYDFTLPGLMSPYHAVRALRKISLFGSGMQEIWPELLSLAAITIIYFMIGGLLYRKRHLSLL